MNKYGVKERRNIMSELKYMLGLLDKAEEGKEKMAWLISTHIAARGLYLVPAKDWEEVRKHGFDPVRFVLGYLAEGEPWERPFIGSLIMDEAWHAPCNREKETNSAVHWWRKGTERGIIIRDIQRIFFPEEYYGKGESKK